MRKLEDKAANETVKLSVIIVSLYSHLSLRKCLDAILANDGRDNIEILVAHCSDEPIADLIDKYPNIRFIQFPQKVGIPFLAGAGIKQAKGEIVALTDASSEVGPGWINAIFEAHQSQHLVIGGAVEVNKQMKPVDWAAYFCEYGQFMLPLKAGLADVLPGNNISFKRSVLERGTEYIEPEFWKTYWCEKLKDEGTDLIAEPAMLIYYSKTFQIVPFFIRRFHHGRCFAGMRTSKSSAAKRMLYLGGSLILPFIFLYRTITTILAKKRFLNELVLSSPFIVLGIVFWSLGETCGYLAGKGKSCELIY